MHEWPSRDEGTTKIAAMDYESLTHAVSRVRADLEKIRSENRLYFAKRSHRKDEIAKHQERKDRVMEIKLELEGLMRRKVA